MNYNESIEFVHSRRKFAKDGTHNRIINLLNLMGNPHEKLKFVHVVGTNGKGSTCTYIASILKCAKYKVGLFTSPFVIEFGERIQIDGEFIEKQSLVEIVGEIKEKIEKIEDENLLPNVFEVTTVLAMTYFFRKNCDIVILEAGIGGEHDSTNVIQAPLVSVFTSISLDHTNLLGDTVEQIAQEKSGIIKEGTTVVCYPNKNNNFNFLPQDEKVINIIKDKCGKLGCDFLVSNIDELEIISEEIVGTKFSYYDVNYNTHLMGEHQLANASVALTAAKILNQKGFSVTEKNMVEGIAKAKICGRMQVLSTEPLVIADGGHNEGCMRELKSTIEKHLSDKHITAIITFVKGKDYAKSLEIISPVCDEIILTSLKDGSNEQLVELEKVASKFCENVSLTNDSNMALAQAKKQAADKSAVVVCGSFYLVSEIL